MLGLPGCFGYWVDDGGRPTVLPVSGSTQVTLFALQLTKNVCCLSRHHKNATPRLPRMWSSNTTLAGLSAIPRHTWSGNRCSSRG